MEGRRRQRWDNNRRSQKRKPPRGCWQPTVPSWEKEFCKVVGSFDWETLLQMKKFTHLYDNIMNWNDSAGEEAFFNAKKRYWAEINCFPCNISLPDPNLYIDKINWDSKTDPDPFQELESKPVIPNPDGQHHDPVVIFGDSLIPNQAFSTVGWGDDEDNNVQIPAIHSSANYGYANNEWQFGDGRGYTPWGGGWGWGWGCPNNHFGYVGPDYGDTGIYGGYGSSSGQPTNHMSRNEGVHHKEPYWGNQQYVAIEERSNAMGACGPEGRSGAITVGQGWNQEKPVS